MPNPDGQREEPATLEEALQSIGTTTAEFQEFFARNFQHPLVEGWEEFMRRTIIADPQFALSKHKPTILRALAACVMLPIAFRKEALLLPERLKKIQQTLREAGVSEKAIGTMTLRLGEEIGIAEVGPEKMLLDPLLSETPEDVRELLALLGKNEPALIAHYMGLVKEKIFQLRLMMS